MIDLKQIQVSLLLHWVVRLCRAQTWEKWAWTPKILYMFFGSRYECFYSNVDIMFTVGCSFKGLDEMKSYFWQAVLKKWIDNNRVDCTSSGCTLLWNNRNVTCQGKVYFKDWITAGIMNVADMMTPEGIASYQDVCKLIGETPNRVLQYNVIHAAVHNLLRDFDNEILNDELTDITLFHDRKYMYGCTWILEIHRRIYFTRV